MGIERGDMACPWQNLPGLWHAAKLEENRAAATDSCRFPDRRACSRPSLSLAHARPAPPSSRLSKTGNCDTLSVSSLVGMISLATPVCPNIRSRLYTFLHAGNKNGNGCGRAFDYASPAAHVCRCGTR